MKIAIVTTTTTTKPTARGSYQELEVVYKNLTFQGKVESKKIMSFGVGAPSFSVLSTATGGSVWEITVVKNDKGFNDWTAAVHSDGSVSPSDAPAAVVAGKGNATPRSTYETPEERAQRQVLIVRQSSLSSAVSSLAIGSKSAPKPAEVIAVAKEFEAYVFGIVDPGPTGFGDIPDFGEAEIK